MKTKTELHATKSELDALASELWYDDAMISTRIETVVLCRTNDDSTLAISYKQANLAAADMYWEVFYQILCDYLSDADEYYHPVLPSAELFL